MARKLSRLTAIWHGSCYTRHLTAYAQRAGPVLIGGSGLTQVCCQAQSSLVKEHILMCPDVDIADDMSRASPGT